MEFQLKQIAHYINGEIIGNPDAYVNKISKIQEAEQGSLTFLANINYQQYLFTTKATAVLISKAFVPHQQLNTNLIVVDDAYKALAILTDLIHKFTSRTKQGIEELAYLSPNSQIGQNVYIGGFAYISENVKISNNVQIFPHTYIGENVQIGEGTIIYAGVKIYSNCVIGKNCIIHSGAVIGSDGFGFAPQEDGTYKKIQQLGNVIIEDDVEIGANTTIDRAAIGSTIIRQGTKLDNLIQIAHNVEVGRNTVMASQSGVAGSTKIGDNCMIGGQAGIAGHLTVANKTNIGAQAGIISSIKDENLVIIGSPAIDFKQYFKSFSVYKNLPEIQRKVYEMDKLLKELKTKLDGQIK